MFAAKFTQVSPLSDKFETDKNGEMPFIGTVIAGKARGTLINGTIFKREKFKAGVVYLCNNTVAEFDGQERINTEIISEVNNPLDILTLEERLGAGVLVQQRSSDDLAEVPAPAEVAQPNAEEVV